MTLVRRKSRKYDPVQHITAGQLRALGFYLAETLPDQAFVPRLAVGLDDKERFDDGTATLRLVVDEPFVAHRDLVPVMISTRVSCRFPGLDDGRVDRQW